MLNVKPEIPVDPNVLAVLEQVHLAAKALGIPYLMIGARAIDIQLHNVHGLPTFNPTNDTDFAVALENWKQFDTLKNTLIETGYFTPDRLKTHRLDYKGSFPVDLVPFGGLENPPGAIAWPADPSLIMKVQGFSEINSAAEEIAVPGSSVILRAASLPGLAVLKFFAWNDRRETRDAWNIASLLQNYHIIIGDSRLFLDEALLRSLEYDTVRAGAALLGKDAAGIVSQSTLSAARNILSGEKRNSLTAQTASGLKAVDTDKRLWTAEGLLTAFQAGFSK